MNNLKTGVLLTLISIMFASCSEDTIEPTVTTADLTESIDENAAVGSVVGTVTGTSNTGTVTFSITSQTPAGALAINATTGELTVADATVFDFETNPTITATVRVADANASISNNASITVNVNDMDDIEFLLSTSKTAYANASYNSWIVITEAEYNTLAEKLNDVSVTGTTDEFFDSTATTYGGGTSQYTLSVIDPETTIPNGGYIFAFKYEIRSGFKDIATYKPYVKQSSTSNYDGFANVGDALPSHTGTAGTYYFVLKGNNTPTTAEGYMAFCKSGYSMGYKNLTNNDAPYHYDDGDVNTLRSTTYIGGNKWLQQGLCTTQRQWSVETAQ